MGELSDFVILDSSTPKYEQLKAIMLDYISGMPLDAEYLPYEYEIREALKVSARTVRRALEALREDGIIETSRKRGSKVIKRPVAASLQRKDSRFDGQRAASLFLGNAGAYNSTVHFPWLINSELEELLAKTGGSLISYNLVESRWQDRERLVSSLRDSGVEWVFLYHHPLLGTGELIKHLTQANIKVAAYVGDVTVFVDLEHLFENTDYVLLNHSRAIYKALCDHFADINSLAYVASKQDLVWARPRIVACEKFSAEKKIPFHLITKESSCNPSGINKQSKNYIHDIKQLGKGTTNALCLAANDQTALDLLATLEGDLPDTISLIGYDNSREGQSSNLSSFDRNAKDIAVQLVDLFGQFLSDKQASLRSVSSRMVFPNLILRSAVK